MFYNHSIVLFVSILDFYHNFNATPYLEVNTHAVVGPICQQPVSHCSVLIKSDFALFNSTCSLPTSCGSLVSSNIVDRGWFHSSKICVRVDHLVRETVTPLVYNKDSSVYLDEIVGGASLYDNYRGYKYPDLAYVDGDFGRYVFHGAFYKNCLLYDTSMNIPVEVSRDNPCFSIVPKDKLLSNFTFIPGYKRIVPIIPYPIAILVEPVSIKEFSYPCRQTSVHLTKSADIVVYADNKLCIDFKQYRTGSVYMYLICEYSSATWYCDVKPTDKLYCPSIAPPPSRLKSYWKFQWYMDEMRVFYVGNDIRVKPVQYVDFPIKPFTYFLSWRPMMLMPSNQRCGHYSFKNSTYNDIVSNNVIHFNSTHYFKNLTLKRYDVNYYCNVAIPVENDFLNFHTLFVAIERLVVSMLYEILDVIMTGLKFLLQYLSESIFYIVNILESKFYFIELLFLFVTLYLYTSKFYISLIITITVAVLFGAK